MVHTESEQPVFLFYRGVIFTAAYSLLGEVRSLVQQTIRVIALTATANTRIVLCRQLCRVIVSQVPISRTLCTELFQTPAPWRKHSHH